jgi:diadenylate cyclase
MNFQLLYDNAILILTQLRLQDLADIILVWVIVYRVLVLIRRTGTIQMLSGLGILAVGYLVSIWLELLTFNWLLEKFFSNLFLIVVILFQAEIRRALAHIGSNPFFTGSSRAEETQMIEEIAKGIGWAAEKGYGALLVIEKEILVDYHIEVGTEIDAIVTSEMIVSIFHPLSPVHDGAVLIRGGRLHSAGSFLPLSKNSALDKNLGTRHRAAIGLTEETDALVFVVSEETKSIGLVSSGHLKSNITTAEVRQALYDHFSIKYKSFQAGESFS